MNTPEVFKPVASNPLYEVSNLGRVRSFVVSREGRIRHTYAGRDGYARVVLSDRGKTKTHYVHRLVAESHVDNPRNLPDINHIDHNKANNTAENLEWITHADNLRAARAHHGNWVRSGEDSPVAKAVIAHPVGGGEPVRWCSARAFALATGNANRAANICAALRTGRPAYGFRWTFANQTNPNPSCPTS